VVFGTGQVGRALATHLASLGLLVRTVSRHQSPALDASVESRPADVTDPEAASDAARGRPMTEDLPLSATTVKSRTRASMTADVLAAGKAGRVRSAIGRASDFFGPGVTEGSMS